MARAVTYDYYTDEYHGTAVAEEDWAHLALVASARLDRIKALATVTPYGDDEAEAESMAICAMAETKKEDYRCYTFRQSHPTLWNS